MLADSPYPNPTLDNSLIFSAVFGVSRGELVIKGQQMAESEREALFFRMISMRMDGYPLQYLLGNWEFCGLSFAVGEGVLIPRPETELLVDVGVSLAAGIEKPVIYDLCSGSGCIAVSVAKRLADASVFALELSHEAFEYLEYNVCVHGASNVVMLRQDVMSFSPELIADIVMSNPPYIRRAQLSLLQREVRFEPVMALDGGEDGLDFFRAIAQTYYDYIKTGGYILFEVGAGQCADVCLILKRAGFSEVNVFDDSAGIERVVSGKKLNCNIPE